MMNTVQLKGLVKILHLIQNMMVLIQSQIHAD